MNKPTDDTRKKKRTGMPTIDVDFGAGWRFVRDWAQGVIAMIPEVREKLKDLPAVNFQLAMDHRRDGQLIDAILRLRVVLRMQPDNAEAWYQLGACQFDKGFREEALTSFRKAVALKPDHEEAHFFMAMLGAEDAPPTIPHPVVRFHFDSLAANYESVFVPQEQYRGHELMRESLAPHMEGEMNVDILDLGCGTGLCGTLFRDSAAFLRGVDISERMLELAKARQVGDRKTYDSLLRMPLEEYLTKETERNYDVIIAASVFNYVGHIAPIVRAVATRLKPMGLFGFSVEKTPNGAPLMLMPVTGHYRHGEGYLRQVAEEAGLTVISITDIALYRDTPGLQCVFKKR